MARKQTFTLEFTPDYDFLLLAIYCAYRDYKLCFELNRALGSGLQRMADLEMKMDKKGSTGLFPYFYCLTEDEEEMYLVSNRGSTGHFIPELRQADFFLLIKNQSRYTSSEKLLKKILSLRIVTSAVEIPAGELKSAENFLLFEPVPDTEEEKPKLPPVI
ncbi:MAG: IPExxxVDY family protein [Bacteroidia bacterium]|nr:IPExxxVDY family protein [Bacteroidia bacterium]